MIKNLVINNFKRERWILLIEKGTLRKQVEKGLLEGKWYLTCRRPVEVVVSLFKQCVNLSLSHSHPQQVSRC
jgi:hypothetical protein